jgi:hypothetical protein
MERALAAQRYREADASRSPNAGVNAYEPLTGKAIVHAADAAAMR